MFAGIIVSDHGRSDSMRMVLAFITFASTLGGLEAQTLKDAMARMRASWEAPAEPFRIIDNVYYVGTQGLSTFLITSPEGHILVDTGLADGNGKIKASIERLGFKPGDIKQFVNTHAHFDHAAGFAELKREIGAPLAASAGDKPLLEGGYYPGRRNEAGMSFPAVKVDRVIRDGDTVTVGGVTLTALMTPGHSPGCTSWTFRVKDAGREHTAIIFCSGTVAANRLVGQATHPTIVEDYRKTFARSRDIKADVFLAPHPEMFGMQEKRAAMRAGAPNPFVKTGEFNAYAATMEKAFEEALTKQSAALKK